MPANELIRHILGVTGKNAHALGGRRRYGVIGGGAFHAELCLEVVLSSRPSARQAIATIPVRTPLTCTAVLSRRRSEGLWKAASAS